MTAYGSNICWTRPTRHWSLSGKPRSDLDTDRKLVLSLIKELEIIGEAAGKVSAEIKTQYGAILWQDISGCVIV